jgi:hypothetical protein
VHVALVAASRFLLATHLGPRTLEMAKELMASVAVCCRPGQPLLLLMDDHRPYPQAILQLFGQTRHRRRRRGRGRKKHADLKPPPGLVAGIVTKVRDARGNLVEVATRALFGSAQEVRRRIVALGLGRTINTAHVERFNGTLRTQQTRLARRTRNVSRSDAALEHALHLWQDFYNWVRPHGSLRGATPAMALGLTEHGWTAVEYLNYPVHVSPLQRALWAEQREELLSHGLNRQKRPKPLPTS